MRVRAACAQVIFTLNYHLRSYDTTDHDCQALAESCVAILATEQKVIEVDCDRSHTTSDADTTRPRRDPSNDVSIDSSDIVMLRLGALKVLGSILGRAVSASEVVTKKALLSGKVLETMAAVLLSVANDDFSPEARKLAANLVSLLTPSTH